MLTIERRRQPSYTAPDDDDLLCASSVVVAERVASRPTTALIEAQADSADGFTAKEAVPAHLLDLDGGEVVILAVKPSPWFVLFRSVRWLAAVTLVAVTLRTIPAMASWITTVTQVGQTAAVLIVAVTIMQWTSRVYVLTNRRMMRFHGVLKAAIFQIPLTRIDATTLSVAPHERITRLGTVYFDIPTEPNALSRWSHIAHPQDVQRTIDDAVRRAKKCESRRDL